MDQYRKPKKFKPIKVPRFLPGEVPVNELMSDLKMYNKHRFNIFSAKPLVDTKPPYMNPYNYLNLKRLTEDAGFMRRIELENKALVCKINYINRTHGPTDCWNTFKSNEFSKWEETVWEIKTIIKRNKEVYQKICNAETIYKRSEQENFFRKALTRIEYNCKYPLVIFDKKSVDAEVNNLPSISSGLPQFDYRPKAFISFRIKDYDILLGQIVIELYSDFAPKTVENFLHFCTSKEPQHSYLNCKIYNSIKGKYFEVGDTVKNNGKGGISMTGGFLYEEMTKLKHSRPGVLSMVRMQDRKKKHKITSKFSITITACPELNGKRAVFGKVVKGNETLIKISDMSKKVGTPLMTIYISKCGEVPTVDMFNMNQQEE